MAFLLSGVAAGAHLTAPHDALADFQLTTRIFEFG
jgi:hypothetical protein